MEFVKRFFRQKNLLVEQRPDKTFSFSDYDAIGFDLDNCLCRYNISELFKLEYNLLSKFIIEQDNHPTNSLRKPYEDNQDFILKGLFLDVKNGNILKIAADGTILQASHGTKQMSKQEISKVYNSFHWSLTDRYVADPLSVWLGESAKKIQVVTDYFDLPVALVYARIIDDIDKLEVPKSYDIFPEILACLHNIYDHEQFFKNKGGFYTALKEDSSKYITTKKENLFDWINSFKKAGKIVFLVTGANFDYASFTANSCLGPNWKDLFDIIIYKARKPGFWHLNRPFKTLNDINIPNEKIRMSESYLEGNYKGLHTLFQKQIKSSHPKVVYIGDSIIQDIYAPNFYCNIDTVAIVEELESEGVFGFSQVNSNNAKSIKSNVWGSFFEQNKVDTIWKKIIRQHSVMVTPSISLLAEHPIEYRYKLSL